MSTASLYLSSIYTTTSKSIDVAICGAFNRTGPLCGSCRNGTYASAYSYDLSCISCEPSWLDIIKYIGKPLMVAQLITTHTSGQDSWKT